MRRIRIYFGDDAVWYIGLNAIAKLNGIGNGNGEERLRGRRRSRALWRTGETSLLFHIISHKFKLYHQIIIKSKFNRKRRKTIEKKRERERERARIVLCFACLFCENGEWWQICNYRGIHGRFWGFGIASRDRAARRTCLVPENEWGGWLCQCGVAVKKRCHLGGWPVWLFNMSHFPTRSAVKRGG